MPRRPSVEYRGEPVDDELAVSALSRYTWAWGANLISKGTKKGDLEQKDVPRPPAYARASALVEAWEIFWYNGPIVWKLLRVYSLVIAFQYTLAIFRVAVSLVPFSIMYRLIDALQSNDPEKRTIANLWPLVAGLGFVSLFQQWLEGIINWNTIIGLSIPISSQLSTLVYEKSLRRKNIKTAEKTEVNIDDDDDDKKDDPAATLKSKQAIVNLIGVDARRIADFLSWQFQIVQSVIKLVMYSAYTINMIGFVPFFAGLVSWAVVLPFNYWSSKKYIRQQDKLMKIRDTKVTIVNEALLGIRQIKFAALEQQWQKRILERRGKELATIRKAFLYDCVVIACWIFSPILLSVVALSVYAVMTENLTPKVAFVSIGIFKSLEMALSVIPEMLTFGMDALISLRRIGAYLDTNEMENNLTPGPDVAIENASVAWPVDGNVPEEERFVLRDLNLSFPQGELSVISGRTGTGKSLLLAALLGEADLLSGSIYMPPTAAPEDRHDAKAHAGNWILPGSVAFVSQTPWLESASLRDNILFGLPHDEARYKEVIEVCALKKDLEILEDGDSTELGANGINLSGGQKWRVTLARAIYSRAEILVMDDIFSAVDAHVGRHIFEKCIGGPICKNRTRILVTHHVGLVQSKTKYVVELGEGKILEAGLTSELDEEGILERIKSHDPQPIAEGSTAVNSEVVSEGDEEDGAALQKVKSKLKDAKKFIEDETHEKGHVKRHVYASYIKASGGVLVWAALFVFFIICEGGELGKTWWLGVWTGHNEEQTRATINSNVNATTSQWNLFTIQNGAFHGSLHQPVSTRDNQDDLWFYLSIWAILSFGTALLHCLRILVIFLTGIRAAKALFEEILFTVLRTPLRWLDTVPVGRILNRMTADFDTIDSRLGWTLSWTMGQAIGLSGICIAAAIVTPIILPPAFILIAVGGFIAKRYMDAARPMKRLESSCKSPVFELFNATLSGITTLRAYQKSGVYKERMHYSLDTWSTNKINFWILNRWMGFRMSLVGAAFSIIVTFLLVTTPFVTASMAGFVLTFAVDFSTTLLFGIRAFAQLELDMNATERVIEYCDLKTEDQGGVEPPAAWPTKGEIDIKDLVVGYAPGLPAVLQGVSFSVGNNERIGVIGRTGAGKSSLTLALFRFLEARSGEIFIDGLDVSKLNLHALRSRLAIIPQDPVLFSGSVRSNLDPFDEHSDEQLRDCLARVHLLDSVPGTPANETANSSSTPVTPKNINIFQDLTSGISESGGNLSQGQRQLLCIARAIVSRPKIMVLDEATSAVDMSTDTLIQRSIREEFTDTTMIVIAHRLSTIADFDRILVLSEGKVAEFGTPKELWNTEGSIFRDMCENSGERAELEKTVLAGK